MGLKLAIVPWFNHPDRGDGGIRRVVEAQVRYLRDYDVEPIENADEADVLMCHGTSLVTRPGKPVVNCNHGLYWSRYDWPLWGEETNALVIDAMANAQAHTVPSRWVGDAVRRGMLVYPEVIYHGVEYDEWQGEPGKHGGYVLWNKARTDAVSDPADMNQVAAMLPKRWFVSTFGNPARNVRLVGKQAHSVIKPLVVEAGVYLATTRETFGIGTLEAMAAGVPIAGWAWGGQLEIVRQGQTGYLAPPGDHRALADAIEACIAERTRLSANCKDDVQERWLWPDKIRQYAMLIHRVHEAYHRPGPLPQPGPVCGRGHPLSPVSVLRGLGVHRRRRRQHGPDQGSGGDPLRGPPRPLFADAGKLGPVGCPQLRLPGQPGAVCGVPRCRRHDGGQRLGHPGGGA